MSTPSSGGAHRLSVLVPVYNAERYLERCIGSVLAQTHSNVEVVAVDDGSTDGSASVLARLAAAHPTRVRVITQANAGVAAARNRAIDAASGDVITFLDNDDYLDPDFAERMLAIMDERGCAVVSGGFRRPNAAGRVMQLVVPPLGSEWERLAVEPAWAKVYRTDFLRERGLRFLSNNIGEDLFLTAPLMLSDTPVALTDYCGYNWFYNDESVSNTLHRSSDGLAFEPLLDALVAEFARWGVASGAMSCHYLVRLVVWFLFYTAKGDDAASVDANLTRYIAWLDANVAGWRRDTYATPFRPTGDAARNRIAVTLFVHHPSLFRRALHAYRRL